MFQILGYGKIRIVQQGPRHGIDEVIISKFMCENIMCDLKSVVSS